MLEPLERMELFTNDRIILDLCGGTGSWSQPYREAGYDVRIVDSLVNGQDVRLFELPEFPVHGILAAPPCTHLAASGARWWAEKGEDKLFEALSIADACLRLVWACKPVWWALENPVGRLSRFYGQPKMYFDPRKGC
jgi:site-specific DNA-cytosine methylase